jgi:hypothetical protein
MALDPGQPGPAGADPAAYAVLVAVVEVLGGRVRSAATTTAELAHRPAELPAAVGGAGSPALAAAAGEFSGAWTRECALLARETRLLADALATAAEHYRSTEWAVGSMTSALLGAVAGRR